MGCQTTRPIGPIYKLKAAEIPEPSVPVAVSIADKRPEAERAYHPGSVDLADFENAFDVLTIDNFDPQPIELLKKSLASQLAHLSPAPTWAEVDLTSFRVVVNRTEIMRAEYERQRCMSDTERMIEHRRLNHEYHKALAEYKKACKDAKRNGDPPPSSPPVPPPAYLQPSAAPAVGVGVGMSVADGGGVGGIIGGIGAGLIAASIVSDLEERRPVIRHVAGFETVSGVTCKIVMHVRLHWPDGRRQEFDIVSESHSPPPRAIDAGQEDPATVLKFEVIPTVQQAIKQAGIQLSAQGGVFLTRQPPDNADNPSQSLDSASQSTAVEQLPDVAGQSLGSAALPNSNGGRKQWKGASRL